MGITTLQLPDASPTISVAFAVALEIVNEVINEVSPLMYTLAVYNLAGSNVLNYAQDPIPTVPYPPDSDSTVGFFAYTRQQLNMLGFVSGVVAASADESTSDSLVVPEAFKEFTLMNLQMIKDPYGRQYLAIAQDYGPAAWGLS